MRAAAGSPSAAACVVGIEQLLILCWALQTEGSKLPRNHDEKISHQVRFLLAHFGTFCGIPRCFSRFTALKNRHVVFVHPLIECRKNWFNLKYVNGVNMVLLPISHWGGGNSEGTEIPSLLLKATGSPGQGSTRAEFCTELSFLRHQVCVHRRALCQQTAFI